MTQLKNVPTAPEAPPLRKTTERSSKRSPARMSKHKPITVTDGYRFHLRTPSTSYVFHETYGDLMADHYGPLLEGEYAIEEPDEGQPGWERIQRRREFPTIGKSDFRSPGLVLAQHNGCETSSFAYDGYRVHEGKPDLDDLASTFGGKDDVSTLEVRMKDKYNDVLVRLFYSVWHNQDVISKWMTIENKGDKSITVKKASGTVELPSGEYELQYTFGNWAQERRVHRARVGHGMQGFQSLVGYTSHLYGQEYMLLSPGATETSGSVWSFNHVYSGSFSAEVERDFNGHVRCQLGINPLHLVYPLAPGATFTTPEVVLSYSSHGIGSVSRTLHRFWRNHLQRSEWVPRPRPTLVNNWEATYFDLNEEKLLPIARRGAELGIQMFVLDDGWFGRKYPRVNDKQGLGDWVVNKERFPHGLEAFGKEVTSLEVGKKSSSASSSGGGGGEKKGERMKFGIWVEPEMMNPRSELYEKHPDWVLHAGDQPRTECRQQLVLNLARRDVQDYIIASISAVLDSAPVSYVKWDNNRGMHELPHPSTQHDYQLGLYRVLRVLTLERYPHVLWEGCASGGGRFDLALCQFFPQHWTSDNSDALDRLFIQFGTSLVFPPSAMGAHVSAVPNHQTQRTTPFEFRAHVALMGGSFGFELDVNKLSKDEAKQIPGYVELSREISPLILKGDFYRLATPWESNWPAALYLSQDGKDGVVFWFQMRDPVRSDVMPPMKLQGLEEGARYELDGKKYTGSDLLYTGLTIREHGDYRSRVMRLRKL